MLNQFSFFQTVRKSKLKLIRASLYDINKAIEAKDHKERPLEEIVLKQYNELLTLFKQLLPDQLPPHQAGIDHGLHIKDGETPM